MAAPGAQTKHETALGEFAVKIIRSPKAFQKEMERNRLRGKTIGFVPTMGALHEGHLSLVRKARLENDRVAVSIFVNPLQFGPKEDFKKYPRTFRADSALLKKAKVDFVFCPTAQGMYPKGFSSFIETGVPGGLRGDQSPFAHLTGVLCGKSRPGHFRGVVTVVEKLFALAKPHRVYFGAKDYQQSLVIRRMIEDLNLDIQFRLVPTFREKDGLAMSSRNRYLNATERSSALVIPETLRWIRKQFCSGRKDFSRIKSEALRRLSSQGAKVDYLEIADPENLKILKQCAPRMIALAACYVGKTRLIDNLSIETKGR